MAAMSSVAAAGAAPSLLNLQGRGSMRSCRSESRCDGTLMRGRPSLALSSNATVFFGRRNPLQHNKRTGLHCAGTGFQDEPDTDTSDSPIQKWLYPSKDELPDDVEMSIWEHLDELRERILISVAVVGAAILLCFFFAKDLVTFLEAPVYTQGVRFLQLSPGEYFFTTLKVSGYSGLLLGGPVILYEIIAFVLPGLTLSERRFLGPIVLGSSILFYFGLFFSYSVLTPAALNFFVSYAEGVVESFWSIDQYFEFVFVLMLSTGLSFQVPVIQLLLGQTGIVSGDQMLSVWKYVVVGAVIAAAVLTPSTDPLTQILLAGPLIGLYMGGAYAVKFLETSKQPSS